MPTPFVHVSTPSRLHFGMLSFGQRGVRQFGGVGLMVDKPGIQLRITPADRLECTGPLAERAEQFARRVLAGLDAATGREQSDGCSCRIEIESASREHIGLGTGTQLGLAIAAGIIALRGLPALPPAELALLAGRAERSSIGTYGFAAGGLMIEAGKPRVVAGLQTEPHCATEGLLSASGDLRSPRCHGQETMTQHELSPLIARVELPAAWRFLLLVPRTATGLFGQQEREAFARIPPVPLSVTEALAGEVLLNLLPAALEADFVQFSRSLYRYGRVAGECFASQQDGPFLDRRTAELVQAIRTLGGEGVGQTSWGPTLFVAASDEHSANEIAARLTATHDLSDYDTLVTKPNRTGTEIGVHGVGARLKN